MQVVDLFIKLLGYESVTPNDGGSLEFIEEYLKAKEFKSYWFNKNGVKNLFLTKEFSKEGEHLCFAGHIDVVPAGDGWDTPPFVPTIKDGFIYARGAQDMKSGVATFLQSCLEVENFNGRLSILLTSDEEGDAYFGTVYALEKLKELNLLPKYAIVAEPTSQDNFGDMIKIGRRGSINGKITINGKQGHAAYPEKAINPIHQIAPILDKIANHSLDNGDKYFAPSLIVITDIRGGMQVTNVTPNNLKIMFNVRNSTKTTKEDIETYIKKQLKELNYTLELKQGSFPFITNKNSKIVEVVKKSIEKKSSMTPKLSTTGGTSDARFFAEYGVEVVEFGIKNDTIHSTNERASIKEIEELYKIFKDILKTKI